MKGLLWAALLLSCFVFAASPPNVITFPITATNATGYPLSGNYNVTIAFYDAYTGGNCINTENQSLTKSPVFSAGVATVEVGRIADLSNLSSQPALFAQIYIEEEALTPRMNLTSTIYALNTQNINLTTTKDITSIFTNSTISNGARTNPLFQFLSGDGREQVSFLRPNSLESNYFYRDLQASDTNGAILYVYDTNASDDQPALRIWQNGGGDGLDVGALNFASNGNAIAAGRDNTPIDREFVGLIHSRASSDGTFYFYRDLNLGSTAGSVMKVINRNETDDQDAIIVQHYTGKETVGIRSQVFNNSAYGVFTQRNYPREYSFLLGSSSASASNLFYRDLNYSDTSTPVVLIQDNNASDDQSALKIVQAALADSIEVSNGTATVFQVNQYGMPILPSRDAGATAVTCNAAMAGAMYLNSTNASIWFCTGAAWKYMPNFGA